MIKFLSSIYKRKKFRAKICFLRYKNQKKKKKKSSEKDK